MLFPPETTDRLATVTRHRRAPAGRPRAGARADGSSGPAGSPPWPPGDKTAERPAHRGSAAHPPLPRKGRPICSETETPRLSKWPYHAARCGVAGSRPVRWRNPARSRSGACGKHRVSRNPPLTETLSLERATPYSFAPPWSAAREGAPPPRANPPAEAIL